MRSCLQPCPSGPGNCWRQPNACPCPRRRHSRICKLISSPHWRMPRTRLLNARRSRASKCINIRNSWKTRPGKTGAELAAFLMQDSTPCGVHVWGGETTVRLPENPGRGGRNQHLALSAAVASGRNPQHPTARLWHGRHGRADRGRRRGSRWCHARPGTGTRAGCPTVAGAGRCRELSRSDRCAGDDRANWHQRDGCNAGPQTRQLTPWPFGWWQG